MAAEANHNRDVAASLQAPMDAYEAEGGSNMFNMVSLRGSFAQTIPFSHPQFQRHFSMFATEAVARDFRAHQFVYPIGGQPPDPNIPIQDTVPYIIPLHLLQNVQINDNRMEREVEGGAQLAREEDQRRPEEIEREGGERAENRSGGVNTRGRKRNLGDEEDSSSDKSSRRPTTSHGTSHVFSFIKSANTEDRPLPPEALEISKLVLEYRSNDLNAAVLAFCWNSGKHHDFPDALVRDLLQYKFINLKKINAGPVACKFDIFARSKDSDPASKIKPKPFKEATEWRDAISLLVETLCIAFVSCFLYVKRCQADIFFFHMKRLF